MILRFIFPENASSIAPLLWLLFLLEQTVEIGQQMEIKASSVACTEDETNNARIDGGFASCASSDYPSGRTHC